LVAFARQSPLFGLARQPQVFLSLGLCLGGQARLLLAAQTVELLGDCA
jgi:hypothetical protein